MRCSHNYVYTQGHFVCTKCGRRTYGRSHRKKGTKKIGLVISGIVVVGIVGFLFMNGVLEFNQENFQESIRNIPERLPEIPVDIPKIPIEVTKPISTEIENMKKTASDIIQPQPSSIEQSKNNIDYINQIRIEKGRAPISFDQRAYELSLARVRDTIEYDYFDHTNPITGSCPDSMKTKYGFSSSEFVAENLAGGIFSPDSAVDLWLTSQGHRYNLLYTGHTAGATACEGGNCVFLGVNNDGFGDGCHTGEEGAAWHESLGKCTDEQFAQMDILQEKYDSLSKEYERFPQMARSQSEYQQAMKMYNELQSLYNQINNFKC
jgi:uncharacterized protein YkwD